MSREFILPSGYGQLQPHRPKLSATVDILESMKIHDVAITVQQPRESAAFYRDVLQLPVDEQPERVTVTVGSSLLRLERGDRFTGVHHLAFGIPPHDFDRARQWLNERVDPIVVEGSEVIEGPEGWNSRSVYFLGPEGILLEFIARQADAEFPGNDGETPVPLSISEVGIGVPDVAAAVDTLTDTLGVSPFPPQDAHFARVGDHNGLLIIVDQEHVWFPTRTHHAARGPSTCMLSHQDRNTRSNSPHTPPSPPQRHQTRLGSN